MLNGLTPSRDVVIFLYDRCGLTPTHRDVVMFLHDRGAFIGLHVRFLFCFTLLLSSFWACRGHRCRLFSPPVLAFIFYRA